VVVEGQELLLTQAHGDKRVVRETQDREKARSASRNGLREELKDIGIKAVIHMHTVRWGQPRAVWVQHTRVETVRVSGGKGSSISPRGGRGVLNSWKERSDEFDHVGVVEPVVSRGVSTGSGDGIKVGRGGVVTKCGASVEDTEVALTAGVHPYQVGVIFQLTKGAADIVVADVDFQPRVRHSEVVQPNHKLHFCTGEGEGRFGAFVGPIVDGKAPNKGAEGAVENWSRVLE